MAEAIPSCAGRPGRIRPARRDRGGLADWRRAWGLLVGGLAASLLLLALLDLVLPAYQWPPLPPSEAFHHTRPAGEHLTHMVEWGPHLVHFNDAGWRIPPSGLPGRPAPGDFRLAVMGDSFVEAIQVTWEETFVGRLEARAAGRGEILNRGISAYSPFIALLRWRRQVAHERPTHLLFLLTPNDVEDDQGFTASVRRRGGGSTGDAPTGTGFVVEEDLYWRPPSRTTRDEGGPRAAWRRLRRRAALLAAPWRYDPGQQAHLWRWQYSELTAPTDRYLLRLAALAEGAGVEFALSAVPSSLEFRAPESARPDPRYDTTFADSAAAWAAVHGIRFIDLQPAFRAAHAQGRRLFFHHDGHFTAAGHAVAAEVFAAAYPELFPAIPPGD